jgi:hypothetical protein
MQKEIRRDKIIGSRRFSNYFWSFILFLGGIGFLLVGFCFALSSGLFLGLKSIKLI